MELLECSVVLLLTQKDDEIFQNYEMLQKLLYLGYIGLSI